MITRLHHAQITVPSGAEEEARRFYCELLGLPETEKPEALRARGGLWLQVGDRQVHIGTEEGGERGGTKAHLAYQVTDLSAWRGRLREQGIEPLEGVPIPGYDRVELRDPFGNRVELIERREEPSGDLFDRIREIEEAAANAWPAGVQQTLDGWRLRYHAGVTHRANSVLCFDDQGRVPLERKVEAVEEFYRRRGLPARFQLNTASLPMRLDAYLEERGYGIPDRTVVMTAALEDLPPPPETPAAGETEKGPVIGVRDALFPAWVDAYTLSGPHSPEQARGRKSILEHIGPPTAYLWADFGANSPERGHVPPGIGLAVLERRWLGIFCMSTRAEFRRQGLAAAIVRTAAQWGKAQGAEGLYLQVSEENTGAIAAYARLGFRPLYHYWYRELL